MEATPENAESVVTAILFSPHNDDEVLWTFYNLLRYKPKVVVVYRSFKEALSGGPTYVEREAETGFAMRVAGVEWEQWEYPDTANVAFSPGRHLVSEAKKHDVVIVPAWEDGGHEQHNAVADALHDHWLKPYKGTVIRYLSYVRGHGRSEGVEIVPTDEERALKAKALVCYPSQANYAPTAPWFGPDQREFVL